MNDKEKYLKDLFSDLKYSVSRFDGQTLAISGGALGFSLTFIKDIVPFNEAIWISLLYASLSLFIYTIGIGFLGHFLSIKQISNSIESVSAERYGELRADKWIPKINLSIVVCLSLGIVLMVVYCVANIENQKKQNKTTITEQTIEIIKNTDNGVLNIKGELKSFTLIDSSATKTEIKIE